MATLRCIDAHQRAVDVLLQRIEGEELETVCQRFLQPPALLGPFHQSCVDCAGEEAERKSTRLNFSHVRISYAVFCLKKKKTPICPTRIKPHNKHSSDTVQTTTLS